MGGRCVVPGCNNEGQHVIPTNEERRCLWMKAMKLEGQILKLKRPLVCSVHFKDNDYMDADIDPLNMKRRHLKRHAVPSIFPWNEAPPPKRCIFISLEERNERLSNSESEMENVESSDPLLKSTDDDNNTTEKSTEMPTSSSPDLEIEYEKEFPFNAAGVKKRYTKQYLPIKFIPELSSLVIDTIKDVPDQDPLCIQESETQQSSEANNCHAESEIDVAYSIEITESVEIKQEENSSDDNMENSVTFSKACQSCGRLPFYSVHSYKNEPNGVHFYTGLETFDRLMFVFYSLGNSVNNLNYFYGEPPGHLDALEQFCMTLLILRRHREFEDIAMIYKTTMKQVTNIFITWISKIYGLTMAYY